MQLDRIEARAEDALFDAARIDAGEMWSIAVTLRSRIDLGSIEILAVVDVLDHHHADELLVPVVMVEGELDQPRQRLDGAEPVDVELRLALARPGGRPPQSALR